MSKYAEPWAATLSGLKTRLEETDDECGRDGREPAGGREDGRDASQEKVFEIYIRTTPERLWEAITDAEMRRKYSFGARRQLRLGARFALRALATPRPALIAEGENLEVDPPRLLVQSFTALWSDEVRERGRLAGHVGDRAGRATPAG